MKIIPKKIKTAIKGQEVASKYLFILFMITINIFSIFPFHGLEKLIPLV